MTAPATLDAFDDASIRLDESRIARAAFETDERQRVAAFTFGHGHYKLTLVIGGQPQTLADPHLLTLLTRARRLLALVAELPATDLIPQERAA